MSEQNLSNIPIEPVSFTSITTDVNTATIPIEDKGKGKSIEPATIQDLSMDDAESSSEDEDQEGVDLVEEPDEDNLKEIDPQNIIPDGRRTRGRAIDFSNDVVADEADYNEDEDDDFVVAEDDEMKD